MLANNEIKSDTSSGNFYFEFDIAAWYLTLNYYNYSCYVIHFGQLSVKLYYVYNCLCVIQSYYHYIHYPKNM